MRNELEHQSQLVAAFAIRMPGRELGYDMAGHLAYLADRLSLARHGFPVVNDLRISDGRAAVDCGVMRIVFDGYNPDCRGTPMFSHVGDFSCRLADHVVMEDLDLFSVSMSSILEEVVATWVPEGVKGIEKAMADDLLFPEVVGRQIGEEIPVVEMLRAVGVEDAESCAREIEAYRHIDRVFSVLSVKK